MDQIFNMYICLIEFLCIPKKKYEQFAYKNCIDLEVMPVDGSLMRSAAESVTTHFDCIEKDRMKEEKPVHFAFST